MKKLAEPREFMLVEASVLRTEMGTALGFIASMRSCPKELKRELNIVANKMLSGKLDNDDIEGLFERCRQLSWNVHLESKKEHKYQATADSLTEQGKVAAAVLMLASALQGVPGTAHKRKSLP